MGDYQPHYFPGDVIPLTLTGTVTGGTLVNAAGTVAGAGDATFLGVADRDGVSGDQINVYTDGVQTLTASGSISAGATVKCAASGQVAAWVSGTDAANLIVGKALAAATNGNPVDILFP
jgi:hypothetical protein